MRMCMRRRRRRETHESPRGRETHGSLRTTTPSRGLVQESVPHFSVLVFYLAAQSVGNGLADGRWSHRVTNSGRRQSENKQKVRLPESQSHKFRASAKRKQAKSQTPGVIVTNSGRRQSENKQNAVGTPRHVSRRVLLICCSL